MSNFLGCSVAAEKLQISMLKCNFSAATEHLFCERVPDIPTTRNRRLIRHQMPAMYLLHSIHLSQPLPLGVWGFRTPRAAHKRRVL